MTLNIENLLLSRCQSRIVVHQKVWHKVDILLRCCPYQISQLQIQKINWLFYCKIIQWMKKEKKRLCSWVLMINLEMNNTWFDRSWVTPEVIEKGPFLCDHAILRRWLSKWQQFKLARAYKGEKEWGRKTYFGRWITRSRDIFIVSVLFKSSLSVLVSGNDEPAPRNALDVFPFPSLSSWSITYFVIL